MPYRVLSRAQSRSLLKGGELRGDDEAAAPTASRQIGGGLPFGGGAAPAPAVMPPTRGSTVTPRQAAGAGSTPMTNGNALTGRARAAGTSAKQLVRARPPAAAPG